MRFILLITLITVHLISQDLKMVTDQKSETPILIGIGTRLDIERSPYDQWFLEEYETYEADNDLVNATNDLVGGIEVVTFIGTWCQDSQSEVPRFFKIFDQLSWNPGAMRLIMLDRDKKSGQNIEDGKYIHHVPTFIFLKNGTEIGRIVESPIESLEEDAKYEHQAKK